MTVTEHDVQTERLRVHVRDTDPDGSSPRGTVVLLHGNCSAFFHGLLHAGGVPRFLDKPLSLDPPIG